MHLFWENLLPNLVQLWTGEFKGLDVGREDYILDKDVWSAIGTATAQAGDTIPSPFGPRLPNIATERGRYTADMWSFWTLYLGPALLHRKFKHAKYYAYFVELVRLLNICLQYELSADDIETLRVGFRDWVLTFEK